jgi:GT2 family glycosyltransferase/spore maturation protein CgeB
MISYNQDDAEAELRHLRSQLADARQDVDSWRSLSERQRVQLERIRSIPGVGVGLRAWRSLAPMRRRTFGAVAASTDTVRRLARPARGLRHVPDRLASPRRKASLRRALASLDPVEPTTARVRIVIPTRSGGVRLGLLLDVLEHARQARPGLELLVVANDVDSATEDELRRRDVDVVWNARNESFSTACNQGADGMLDGHLLFLNDDVEPLDEQWLDRMILAAESGAQAVGAQLVHGARRLRDGGAPEWRLIHAGVRFEFFDGAPAPRNLGGSEPRIESDAVKVGAATAACLLVDATWFREVGGFDDRYHYGAEDIDLCWRLRQSGGQVAVARGAVLSHVEGSTRLRGDRRERNERQAANWDLFHRLHGPSVAREVRRDRLEAAGVLAVPTHVAITVTRAGPGVSYGDGDTADGLSSAFESLGWTTSRLERHQDRWYDVPPRADVVFSLLDTYDVRRVDRRGRTTIAWVRNWVDRWIAAPWFEHYDVVLVASEEAAKRVAASTRHRPVLFPLATDAERFAPSIGTERPIEALIPANHWGLDRGVPELVEALGSRSVLVGAGWEELSSVHDVWRGEVPRSRLPGVYASARYVIDAVSPHVVSGGGLNARVFDALAAGSLPITNHASAAAELFGDDLLTWNDPADVVKVIDGLERDPGDREDLLTRLRERVLAEHTYATRAATIQQLLLDRNELATLAIGLGAPNEHASRHWGDRPFAEALAAELRAIGHHVTVHTRADWDSPTARAADVTVQLKGRGSWSPAPGQRRILWIISHPDELTDEELDGADLVLAASDALAQHLRTRTSTPVDVMLQATDHRRFVPYARDPQHASSVLFVGNSKFTRRPVVDDAIAAGVDLTIIGREWEGRVPPELVRSRWVDNDELAHVYCGAEVVLNDHWPVMRRWGIISNRIFDVLACGRPIVSDDVPGLREHFGELVTSYGSAEDLPSAVEYARELGRRPDFLSTARAAVVPAHTFEQRATELLAHLTRWDFAGG